MERDEILQLSDDKLLKICELDFFIGTGPGGQKKNKTESAVRLTYRPRSISSTASEDRQQSINRTRAIKRMRIQLALEWRAEAQPWNGQWNMNPKNDQYSLFIACLLDNLAAFDWQVSEAAAKLNISTGQLIKLLAKCDPLWQFVNQQRQKHNYKALRRK